MVTKATALAGSLKMRAGLSGEPKKLNGQWRPSCPPSPRGDRSTATVGYNRPYNFSSPQERRECHLINCQDSIFDQCDLCKENSEQPWAGLWERQDIKPWKPTRMGVTLQKWYQSLLLQPQRLTVTLQVTQACVTEPIDPKTTVWWAVLVPSPYALW